MTHFQYTPFVIPLALSAAVVVAMLVVAWRNRDAEVAPWFAASLVALLVWTVGYLLELMAVGVGAKIFWADLQFIATASLPLLWLEVVLIYTGRGRLPVAARAALWAVCALLVITVFLNPAHLFRGDPSVVMHGSLTALSPDYGPIWRYAGMPWVYGLYFLILLVLLRGMVHARRIYVRQYAALLAATALPLAAGSLYTLGVSPWPEYNPAMPVVAVSGVLMAYALFHYRLFDVAPLARDAVIDELADGLVVVDVESRLRDFNAARPPGLSGAQRRRYRQAGGRGARHPPGDARRSAARGRACLRRGAPARRRTRARPRVGGGPRGRGRQPARLHPASHTGAPPRR